jgi:hypothetical protein
MSKGGLYFCTSDLCAANVHARAFINRGTCSFLKEVMRADAVGLDIGFSSLNKIGLVYHVLKLM